MAKITNQEWYDLMNRIHSGRSCLTQEAQKLEITLDELIAMGDETHKGGDNEKWKEWCKTKRESSKRDKKMARPRKMRKPAITSVSAPAQELAPAPDPAPAPALAPEPAPAPAAPADRMEELLHKREKLQRQNADCASFLEKAEAILDIRQGGLADAKAVLEKAKKALSAAVTAVAESETSVKIATIAVQQAQAQQAQAQQELRGVEQAIQELKEKSVYLIDPWYTGELPQYGTFLSTAERKGVTIEEVPEEYIPERTIDGVLLFDFVPSYEKARVFCGLVAKYEIEGTPYQLLVSDERVEELLKMYIGK